MDAHFLVSARAEAGCYFALGFRVCLDVVLTRQRRETNFVLVTESSSSIQVVVEIVAVSRAH